ncbi:DUF6455 family protein [Tabrizicola oligotrophica]|uniref:DUF6455 domain-containing protein n=1 Tax=Tabrizicola oligotrophica TaxID=2710650 RepID=A0A6M0QVC6_9RHOB|nr:DUF6455 family protein [Tabrizicola oligotrophica]NEY90412.1 hypothetical protein [Tabrizicola oligotrophica]
MIGYPEAPRAWGFTRGMARTVGISLTEAVVEGWLSRGELGCMVEACRTCGQTVKCTDWLASTVKAEALPDFCQNAPAIGSLRG